MTPPRPGSPSPPTLLPLFEEEALTDVALPPALTALYRGQPRPAVAEYGARSNQTAFLRRFARKFVVALGPKLAAMHAGARAR